MYPGIAKKKIKILVLGHIVHPYYQSLDTSTSMPNFHVLRIKSRSLVFHILVSRFMCDGKSQSQPCVLIDGTAPVLAAHSTDGSKTCTDKGNRGEIKYFNINYDILSA